MTNQYSFINGWEDLMSGGQIYVQVYQNGALLSSVTLSSGTSGSQSVLVASGSPVVLKLFGTDWFECFAFSVDTNGGTLNASLSNYSNGDTIAVINDPCPSCPAPVDLVTSMPYESGFTLAWMPSSAGEVYHVYLDGFYVASTSDTSYSFTNLSPSTVYTAGVRVVCSDEDSSALSTATCKTTCALLTALPYVMDFEAEPTGSGSSSVFNVTCWNRLTNATSYPYVYVNSNGSNINHTDGGSKGIWWYRASTSSGYGSYHCLVLPPIDLDSFNIADLSLHFWAHIHNPGMATGNPVFYVGVMTDPTDINTFTYIDTIQIVGTDINWRLYGTNPEKFANYTGTGNLIAIRENFTGVTWYTFLDDVTITEGWCDMPENVTYWPEEEEITVSWTGVPGMAYTVYCGEDTVEHVTDTFYTFTGLQANTDYVFGVASECESTKSIFTVQTGKTSCAVVSVLPYTEDFESATADGGYMANPFGMPCWRRVTDNISNDICPNVNTGAPNHTVGGNKGLMWTYYSSSAYGYGSYSCLVTPPIDTSVYNMSDLQVHFWAKPTQSYYTNGGFMVGVMTNPADINTFDSLGVAYVSDLNWQYYGVSLSGYTGSGRYIALVPIHGVESYNYLDDISITEGWCPMVQNLGDIADTDKVTLYWEANGGTLFTATLDTFVVSNITDTFYTFTGLTPNTPYNYSVSAVCGGVPSVATLGKTRTSCLPILQLPWTEDFETAPIGSNTNFDFVPCWHMLTDALSKPYLYVYSNTYNPTMYNHTENGMRSVCWAHNIYDDYTYEYLDSYHYLVLPPFDANAYPINSLQLKFWARSQSNSQVPIILVGAMSNPTDITTFDTIAVVTLSGDDNNTWKEYNVLLNDYLGDAPYIALHDGGSGWTMYIDDITLDEIPPCPPIKGLKVDAVTAGSAYVSWGYQPGIADPDSYVVEYAPVDTASAAQTTAVLETHAALLQLWPNTKYYVKVYPNCPDGDGAMDSIVFITKDFQCLTIDPADPFNVQIGSGTDLSSNFPVGGAAHTVSQQIYYTNEIGESTTLGSLSIKPYEVYTPDVDNIQIYLAHTTATTLLNGFVSPDDMTLVYDGEATSLSNAEWYTFTFDVPFAYDTTKGNLLVTFLHNGQSCFNYYYVDNTYPYYTAYYTNSSTNIDINSLSSSYMDQARNCIKLGGGSCGQMATCSDPGVVVEYVSADSVVVGWIPGNDETTWDVSYRLVGDTTWIKVDSDLTAMQYVFDSLNPNTEYEFMVSFDCDNHTFEGTVKVRTGCGLLKQLPLVEDFENVPVVGMMSKTNFIPCWSLLSDGMTTELGITSGNNYNVTAGGSKGYYMYGTPNYGTHTTIVLPGIDTEVIPINRVSLSFWAKRQSYYSEASIIVGAMSDPTNDETFVGYDTLTISNTTWEQTTIRFTGFESDTCNYVAIRGLHALDMWQLILDDIVLDEIPPCEPVEALEVMQGTTSAILTWESYSEDYQGVIVEYKPVAGTTWDTLWATGQTYAVLTGLDAGTPYQILVTAFCGEDSMLSVTLEKNFVTKNFGCAEYNEALAHSDTVMGTENMSASYLAGGGATYGYGQQLYYANEIGNSGHITSIALRASNINNPNRHLEIYMAHTITSNLLDFEHPVDMVKVYDGTTAFVSNQWNTIVLDEPFHYDDDYNLLVSFRDVTGTNTSNTFHIHSSNASYFYTDYSMPIDPYTVTGGEEFYYRNDMIFNIKPCVTESECAAPPTMVTGVGATTVDVAWTKGNTETAWNTYYRLASSEIWIPAATGVTDTFYTFTDLEMGHDYELMVESVCSEAVGTVVTASTECSLIEELPFVERFDDWGIGGIPPCWSRGASGSSANISIRNDVNHSVLPSGYNSTGGSLFLYSTGGTSFSQIVLPELDTSVIHANELQLRFASYRVGQNYAASGNPIFVVGVQESKDDHTTFVAVDTVTHTGDYMEWQMLVADLSGYEGNGAYIVVRTSNMGYFNTYVDDFVLDKSFVCAHAEGLTATASSATSVSAGWDEIGDASAWQLSYGALGFAPDEGTLVTTGSNPYVLTPTTAYGEFYVRALCDDGDTGGWNFEAGTFYLPQVPATIPYNYDFEDAVEWSNWQQSSSWSALRLWTRGTAVAETGSYGMYVSGDGGVHYTPYYYNSVTNVAAFRDIDFGTIDSSFTLTFSARAGGTEGDSWDGLKVYVVDAGATPVASMEPMTTPWGAMGNLTAIATVGLSPEWQTYQASIDDVSGVHRVVFFWYNQGNLMESEANEPAAIDNIEIDYSSCPRPLYISLDAIDPHNATFSWQGASDGSYEVRYGLTKGNSFQSVMTDTLGVTLTGLDSIGGYSMWVRKFCGNGDTSLWTDAFEFTTPFCNGGTVAYNYDESMEETAVNYGPIGTAGSGNCYLQMLVDSAHMASIGSQMVSSFAYKPLTAQNGAFFTCMYMWMANVPETTLNDGWIYSDNTTHVFEQVLDNADFSFSTDGWQIHPLETPFAWDGHSSVLITVLRNHNSSISAAPTFAAHATEEVMTLLSTRNGTPFVLDQPNYASGYNVTGDIMLMACSAPPSCDLPSQLYADNISYQGATLHWTGNANSYEVRYKTSAAAGWNNAATLTVTDTSCQIAGLMDSTKYVFRVRGICTNDESGLSIYTDWAQGSFTTLGKPCMVPSTLIQTSIAFTNATFNWNENGTASKWNLHVWNGDFEQYYTATSRPYTVTGLTAGTAYYVAVSAQCGDDEESEYSDTVSITTPTCQKASGLASTSVSYTTATFHWNGSASSYDLEYGDKGFTSGENTFVVHVTGKTYSIAGLEPGHEYSVSVRAECETGVYSAYCDQVDFVTLQHDIESIDEAGQAGIDIYPNPTSEQVTIAISGVVGEVEIAVVDLSGRMVMKDSLSCDGDCAKKVEVAGLSQGAYFVRISGENVNMVKKLIVK